MKNTFLILILILSFNSVKAQEKTDNKLPFSPTIKVDNLVFVSGQVGIDPVTSTLVKDGFESEVRQIMVNLQTLLKPYSLTLDDLASTIIYLKDMNNYDVLNQIYGSYFKERFPTRTCIAVADLPAGASVEISGIAHMKNKSEKNE